MMAMRTPRGVGQEGDQKRESSSPKTKDNEETTQGWQCTGKREEQRNGKQQSTGVEREVGAYMRKQCH
jgi:hypothetical protein